MSNKTYAAHNRNTSEQTVGTPRELLDPIERRFGELTVDLAATSENAVCGVYITREDDSLSHPWAQFFPASRDLLWLNPPYNNAGAWAEKCVHEMQLGARILFLVPASVGSNWFQEFVVPHAHVIELSPRVKFVGHTTPFPKDLVLCVFWGGLTGRSSWRWKA